MLSSFEFIYLFLFLKNFGSHAVSLSYHCVCGPRPSHKWKESVFWWVWPVLAGVPFVVAPSVSRHRHSKTKKILIREVEGRSNSSKRIAMV